MSNGHAMRRGGQACRPRRNRIPDRGRRPGRPWTEPTPRSAQRGRRLSCPGATSGLTMVMRPELRWRPKVTVMARGFAERSPMTKGLRQFLNDEQQRAWLNGDATPADADERPG